MSTRTLWRDLRLATMDGDGLGLVDAGCVLGEGGRIAYAGPEAGLARSSREGARVVECGGRLATPGLVDCHTHLVFGGDRAREFEMRLDGATYEAIARAGGGIVSSVRATRLASENELVASAARRLDHLLAEGVTTVEVKSGYGLDTETEIRCLRAARRLARERDVTILTSFLGAHALPPEADGDRDGYIERVVTEMLPAVAAEGLADAVDVFCETIAFSPAQTERVFAAARDLGLPVKLHADQLSNGGGAALAARWGALSADHLEHTDEAGAAAMGRAGTVAVLLPGAFYALRETQAPPVDAFRRHGVRMAIATDSNPGTSPLTSLLLAANMAATLFRMTVPECLAGITREAAHALGLGASHGVLGEGRVCDIAIWDAAEPAELVYRIGYNPLWRRVHGGVDRSASD